MKQIPLTKGQFALVDDEDFEWLNQWKWHAKWSDLSKSFTAARREGKRPHRKYIYMHRQIMDAPPGMECDHINHDSLDNRRSNLRVCSHAENLRNRRIRGNNSSGFIGVSWHHKTKKWASRIKFNGKGKHLGLYTTKVEAAKRYDACAIELFGEFANLNFPSGDTNVKRTS